MNLEKIRQLQAAWLTMNPQGIPTHLLVHPAVMAKLWAQNEHTGVIHDRRSQGKPATINGIEIVEVDAALYPSDFMKIVGGAE